MLPMPPPRPALAALSMILCTLTGCTTATVSGGTEPPSTGRPAALGLACSAFQPIPWASADTDATLRAVRAHNAAYLALCPRPPADTRPASG